MDAISLCSNFDSEQPQWMGVLLPRECEGKTIIDFVVDAFSPLYQNKGFTLRGWVICADGAIVPVTLLK